MSTYSEVQNKIRSDIKIGASAISNEIIRDCIQRAINFYSTYRFWFNVKVGTITIDSEYVDLPSDFISPITLSFAYSGCRYVLKPTSYNRIEHAYTDSNTSRPSCYSIVGKQLRIYPIPDNSYTGYIYYVYKLTDLSADNDTNDWIDGAEELIKAAAKKRIYANHLFNKDETAINEAEEFKCLTELKIRTGKHNNNRTIKGSEI